ncbi:hypothetical protein [Spirosoma endbachense]|uniref:Uncharacterized protein n=1 Tax=Spirosoma endbachense TaxID=2666025 RepID=A0A6P1VWL3_9BACT|nr:hypothetical protein [Spirosoma endbachense]QHV96462.1 hypothetical protein GJR95_16175 [Spirosoma endbachense]
MSIGRIIHTLIAIAVMALVSLYGYYYARESVAKWAFSHQTYFAPDKLILITIPQPELSNQLADLVNEPEFEWNGHMVDVLYREIRSDSVYIYGFRDDAETELKQKAPWLYQNTASSDFIPGTRSGNHRKQINWRSKFDLPYLPLFDQLELPSLSTLSSSFYYCTQRLARPDLEVPSPPPNL